MEIFITIIALVHTLMNWGYLVILCFVYITLNLDMKVYHICKHRWYDKLTIMQKEICTFQTPAIPRLRCNDNSPLMVWLVHFILSYLCFILGRILCQYKIIVDVMSKFKMRQSITLFHHKCHSVSSCHNIYFHSRNIITLCMLQYISYFKFTKITS